MRIYGFEDTGQPVDTVMPSPLAEVTVTATAAELRVLADFLRVCADEMDQMGAHFDTSTYQTGLKSSAPHLISSSLAIERATM